MSKEDIKLTPIVRMSWDVPIEQEILNYVRTMAANMEMQATSNIWGKTRKSAAAYADACRSIERHIIREIEVREKIARITEVRDEQ